MQVRTRPDQDEPLRLLAFNRRSSAALETQAAIDAHLAAHRELLKRGPKLKPRGKP